MRGALMSSGTRTIVATFALGVLLLGACSSNKSEPQGGSSPGKTTIAVTVQEWAVLPAQASAAAGAVTFNVKNKGPGYEHEFVLMKTTLAPDNLPTKADGSINEDDPALTPVDEIGDIALGKTESKSFTLAAGSYVLFCNVVENNLVHYKLGMRTAFSVT
jgi:uncharacterized cupredoxin-like copper-binding protein